MSEALLIAKLNMIASKIAHEDNLIGQRTTWLVMSQAFLFGAFAALVAEMSRVGTAGPLAKLLRIVIPLVGVLLPFLVLLAVGAATFALSRWRTERARILAMPEAKNLDWPQLDHPAGLLLGQLLPPRDRSGIPAGMDRDSDPGENRLDFPPPRERWRATISATSGASKGAGFAYQKGAQGPAN